MVQFQLERKIQNVLRAVALSIFALYLSSIVFSARTTRLMTDDSNSGTSTSTNVGKKLIQHRRLIERKQQTNQKQPSDAIKQRNKVERLRSLLLQEEKVDEIHDSSDEKYMNIPFTLEKNGQGEIIALVYNVDDEKDPSDQLVIPCHVQYNTNIVECENLHHEDGASNLFIPFTIETDETNTTILVYQAPGNETKYISEAKETTDESKSSSEKYYCIPIFAFFIALLLFLYSIAWISLGGMVCTTVDDDDAITVSSNSVTDKNLSDETVSHVQVSDLEKASRLKEMDFKNHSQTCKTPSSSGVNPK